MNAIKLKIDLSTVLMTDIKLWDKAKKGYCSLYIAVDTGASITTISKEILHHAGYDISTGDIRKFTTASGANRNILKGSYTIEIVTCYKYVFSLGVAITSRLLCNLNNMAC